MQRTEGAVIGERARAAIGARLELRVDAANRGVVGGNKVVDGLGNAGGVGSNRNRNGLGRVGCEQIQSNAGQWGTHGVGGTAERHTVETETGIDSISGFLEYEAGAVEGALKSPGSPLVLLSSARRAPPASSMTLACTP